VTYTARDFFHTVLAESGLVCVGRLAPAKGSPFMHDVYDSIDDMLSVITRTDADFTKQNYYFAVSTLKQRSVVERGKERVRTQSNMLNTRAVILDVDIKSDEKYYATKEEAWAGIQRISAQLAMPEPIIVDSGFGYHVYWPMAAGVPSKDWQSVAKSFYQAVYMMEPKLVADASRVSDTASVLRIPGTFNLKFGQRTEVQIVQWYSDYLDFGDFRNTLARITGIGASTPTVGLTQGERTFEKAPLALTLRNCNWTKNYIVNAATATEPEWYAMMGIAPFVEHSTSDGTPMSGEDIAHLFSKSHPEYSPDTTAAKYAQAKAAQTGPTTCAKLQQINPTPCENCPFRGAVKTPLQTAFLSRPATQAQAVTAVIITDEGNKQEEQFVIPLPPKPYFRGDTGGVYTRIKEQNDDGSWNEHIAKIYDYDLYPVKRYRSELKEEEQLEMHLWLPKDGVRRFKMPTELLADHSRLATFLTSRGAIPETGASRRMAKYLVDYTRHMQTESLAEVEYSRFGWRDATSDTPKFVVGNGYIDKEGNTHAAAFPNYLRSAATAVAAHGDIEQWKQGFNVYRSIPNSEAYIFTLMLGFAAPAMTLTPYAGVMYNMVGQSGMGKSTALALMASTWGVPNPARIKIDDTPIATYNTIGYLHSVPVAFDEATNMDNAMISQFALNFTGGRGKDRAGRDGQNKDNLIEWDTIVACTSNTSLYEKFTANRKGYNAESMRLFEVKIPKNDPRFKQQTDQALHIVTQNYGHAGRVFIPYVMRNSEAIKKAIEVKTNQILQRVNGSTAERFWATLIATVVVLGSIAKKIGLHEYDMDAIEKWAIGQVYTIREEARSSGNNAIAFLGEFVNANLPYLLQFKDDKQNIATLQMNASSVIKGRIDVKGDKTTIVVSTKSFHDFCAINKIDAGWMLSELKQEGITDGRSYPARIATGTNLPNPSVRAFRFDYNRQIEGLYYGEETKEPPTSGG
jgi:hypothetical protein